jgi:hypothetical protein
LADHRIVHAEHVKRFLGSSLSTAHRRLRALRHAGYVRSDFVFDRQPACLQVTRDGLAAIGSSMRAPKRDLRAFTHDVGVAWLWLAARDGAFGELREIVAERRLRSRDTPARRADPPLAVRLFGEGPVGAERLHYPDLLLVTAGGRRIALELELTGKTRTRREQILTAYGADPRIDAVVYLVADRRVGNPVISSARRVGVSQLVEVQTVKLADGRISPAVGRAAQRSHRASRREGPER